MYFLSLSLDGVVLMDGVTVGSNSRLSRSILGSDVFLGVNVTLEPGCVLGSKVKIGDGVKLASGTELTTADEFSSEGVCKGQLLTVWSLYDGACKCFWKRRRICFRGCHSVCSLYLFIRTMCIVVISQEPIGLLFVAQ